MRRRPFWTSSGLVGVVAVAIVLLLAVGVVAGGYLWAIGPIAQAPDSGPVPAVGLPSGPAVAAWELRDSTTKVAPSGVADLVNLVVVDSRSQVRILPMPVTDSCHQVLFGLVLSPDGTRLAVVGSLNCGAPPFTQSVRVVDVLHDVVVGTLPGGDGGVAWDPDSTRLVVANIYRPGDITTSSGTVLGHVPSGFEPHWAPSSLIALSAYDAKENVVVFRGDASRVTQLSGYSRGRWINDDTFAAGRADLTDLLKVDGTGNTPSTLVQTYPCPLGPLSPDSKTVVGIGNLTVGAFKNSVSFLQTCDEVTGHLKRLSPNYGDGELEGMAWLPDGLLAVLIGHTYQTIDVETGRHHILALTDRSSSFHYFYGLTTASGG